MSVNLDLDDVKLDIHHIFPRKWCEDSDIPPRVYNAIVNKTAFSYKANRMIGGSAPSKYLAQLQGHAQVKLADAEMDDILKSHVIDAALLRADTHKERYAARKAALLSIVERAMGKMSAESASVAEDEEEGEAARRWANAQQEERPDARSL